MTPTPTSRPRTRSRAEKASTIALIDDGVDIDHAEFGGAGKLVAPA